MDIVYFFKFNARSWTADEIFAMNLLSESDGVTLAIIDAAAIIPVIQEIISSMIVSFCLPVQYSIRQNDLLSLLMLFSKLRYQFSLVAVLWSQPAHQSEPVAF